MAEFPIKFKGNVDRKEYNRICELEAELQRERAATTELAKQICELAAENAALSKALKKAEEQIPPEV